MKTDILTKIVDWAEGEEPVRALVLEGSQAAQGGVDALSDYDVNMFITEPASYVEDDSWIHAIEKVWVYIPPKRSPTTDVLREFAAASPLHDHYDAGYCVLLDKDRATANMQAPTFRGFRSGRPTADEFTSCVREFWYETHYVAKNQWRDGIWPVNKSDWVCKGLLLRMVEWHERGKHDWDYWTHPRGRRMRSWAAPETSDELSRTFATYDAEDGWSAAFAMYDLFSRLARETAEMLGYAYPVDVEQNMVSFAKKLQNEATS